jgi:phosphatidylinositol-3-phosphatase
VAVDSGQVCPIAGTGKDAEDSGRRQLGRSHLAAVSLPCRHRWLKSVPAATTVGKTIADQLAHVGMTWKSYQESLPLDDIFGVNYGNGTATNLTDFSKLALLISQTYAVKHNPFAYFKGAQEGYPRNNSLSNIVGFDGPHGLYADLATGEVPSLAFISPNQCNDQHERGNGDAFCGFDFGDSAVLTYGTQVGLIPGLIQQGDVTIQRLVEAIEDSPVWDEGRNAIVIVWEENDYSGISTTPNGLFPSQNQNKVVLTMETNQHTEGVQSRKYYNSFSLLRSREAGFGLPCLNHACDKDAAVMSDLFPKDED